MDEGAINEAGDNKRPLCPAVHLNRVVTSLIHRQLGAKHGPVHRDRPHVHIRVSSHQGVTGVTLARSARCVHLMTYS